jgi:hypothetical protein
MVRQKIYRWSESSTGFVTCRNSKKQVVAPIKCGYSDVPSYERKRPKKLIPVCNSVDKKFNQTTCDERRKKISDDLVKRLNYFRELREDMKVQVGNRMPNRLKGALKKVCRLKKKI